MKTIEISRQLAEDIIFKLSKDDKTIYQSKIWHWFEGNRPDLWTWEEWEGYKKALSQLSDKEIEDLLLMI